MIIKPLTTSATRTDHYGLKTKVISKPVSGGSSSHQGKREFSSLLQILFVDSSRSAVLRITFTIYVWGAMQQMYHDACLSVNGFGNRLEQVAVDDWKRVENIELLGCLGLDKFKNI